MTMRIITEVMNSRIYTLLRQNVTDVIYGRGSVLIPDSLVNLQAFYRGLWDLYAGAGIRCGSARFPL